MSEQTPNEQEMLQVAHADLGALEIDRDALVRYAKALVLYRTKPNAENWKEVGEAYEALSQELRDAISGEAI